MTAAGAALEVTLEFDGRDKAYNHWLWRNRADYPDLSPVRITLHYPWLRPLDTTQLKYWIEYLGDSGNTVTRQGLPGYDRNCSVDGFGGRYNVLGVSYSWDYLEHLESYRVGVPLDRDELLVTRIDDDSTVSRVYDRHGRLLFGCHGQLARLDERWFRVSLKPDPDTPADQMVEPLDSRGRPVGRWPVWDLDRVISSGNGLYTAETGSRPMVFDLKGRTVWDTSVGSNPVVSPDGRTVVVCAWGSELLFHDLKSRRDTVVNLLRLEDEGLRLGDPLLAWSEDGSLLSVYEPLGVLYDADSYGREKMYTETDSGVLTVFSRTGSTVRSPLLVRGGLFPRLFTLDERAVMVATDWGRRAPYTSFFKTRDSLLVTVVPFVGEPETALLPGIHWSGNAWRWRLLGRALVCDGDVRVVYRIRNW